MPLDQNLPYNDIIAAIESDWTELANVPQKWREPPWYIGLVYTAISQNAAAFEYIDSSIKENASIIHPLASTYPLIYDLLPQKLRKNQQIVRDIVKKDPKQFQFLDEELKLNKDIVSCALIAGLRFEEVPESWRENEDVVLLAMELDPSAFQLASDKLTSSWRIRDAGKSLPYPKKWSQNENFVLDNIKTADPQSFEKADDLLKDNEDFIVKVVKKISLEHLPQKWSDNAKVVLAAIEEKSSELNFASANLLENNEELILKLVKKIPLKDLPQKWSDNAKVVLAAIEANFYQYQSASANLLENNKELILKLVKNISLSNFHKKWGSDEDVVLAALEKSFGTDLAYAAPELLANKNFIIKASKYLHANDLPATWKNDEDVALIYIEKDAKNIFHFSPDLKQNQKFLKKAAEKNPILNSYALIIPPNLNPENTKKNQSPNLSPEVLTLHKAIARAQELYAAWYENVNVATKTEGSTLNKQGFDRTHPGIRFKFFNRFHGSFGQDRAKLFNHDIQQLTDESEIWSRIKFLVNDPKTRFRQHSFASFLLDELIKINKLIKLMPSQTTHIYDIEDVATEISKTINSFK